MGKLDILNCAASGRVEFEFVCPMTWEQMAETGAPNRRFCASCQRTVHRCHDANEAGLRAEQGECIAVPDWLARGVRTGGVGEMRIIIGQPTPLRDRMAEVVERRMAEMAGAGDAAGESAGGESEGEAVIALEGEAVGGEGGGAMEDEP